MVRILHVTESMASGVMVSVAGLARCQVTDGHDVAVLHTRRPESPGQETLAGLFPEPIRRIELLYDARKVLGFFRLATRIAKEVSVFQPDVIHLHSTYAGLSGRLTALLIGKLSATVYSPHGFAFMNTKSRLRSRVVVQIEGLFNRLGGKLALVSESELRQAQEAFGARRSYVLQNRLSMHSLPARTRPQGDKPLIGTVGRISYAKGPWRFAEVARRVSDKASAVWIGDGATADKAAWFQGADIQVSGWQSPEQATKLAANLDIYVSTALWEGMPLAVMEAQALGVPCVVSAIGGNVDAVEHKTTGFVCSTIEDLVEAVECLIEDEDLRKRMGKAAALRAAQQFSDSTLSSDSLAIYSA